MLGKVTLKRKIDGDRLTYACVHARRDRRVQVKTMQGTKQGKGREGKIGRYVPMTEGEGEIPPQQCTVP